MENYYKNLRRTFVDDDGAEIVGDIENRVAEIIADSHPDGAYGVVTIEEVNEIITRMGRPDELASAASDMEMPNADSERPGPPPYRAEGRETTETSAAQAHRRLYRDMNDKVIAGVISGLACYLGVSVTALRLSVVIVALCTMLWPLVMLYVIAWLLIPAAETPRQILEMTGRRVTVDSVGRATIFGTPDPEQPLTIISGKRQHEFPE